jgi:hypothetical protein
MPRGFFWLSAAARRRQAGALLRLIFFVLVWPSKIYHPRAFLGVGVTGKLGLRAAAEAATRINFLLCFLSVGGVVHSVRGEEQVRLVSPHPFAKETRCVLPFQFVVLAAVSVDFSVGLRVRGAAARSCNCFSPPFPLCDCRCSFNVVYVPWRVRGAVSCGVSNAWDPLTAGMETLLLATAEFGSCQG